MLSRVPKPSLFLVGEDISHYKCIGATIALVLVALCHSKYHQTIPSADPDIRCAAFAGTSAAETTRTTVNDSKKRSIFDYWALPKVLLRLWIILKALCSTKLLICLVAVATRLVQVS